MTDSQRILDSIRHRVRVLRLTDRATLSELGLSGAQLFLVHEPEPNIGRAATTEGVPIAPSAADAIHATRIPLERSSMRGSFLSALSRLIGIVTRSDLLKVHGSARGRQRLTLGFWYSYGHK